MNGPADLDGHTHGGRYHSHIGGGQPHDHAEPAPAPARRGGTVPLAILAAGLFVLRLAVPFAQVYTNADTGQSVSLSQAHLICASGLGQMAQTISLSAANACSQVSAAYAALDLIGVAAVVCAAGAVWLAVTDHRGRRPGGGA